MRLNKLYDEIEEIETLIEEVETGLYNIRQEKKSGDNVYQFLLFFDKLDEELINKILSKKDVVSFVLSDGTDLRILEWVKRQCWVAMNIILHMRLEKVRILYQNWI